MASKAALMTAKRKLAKAKVKMTIFQRKARREMAKMAVTLKRHQRALKLAATRYRRALRD